MARKATGQAMPPKGKQRSWAIRFYAYGKRRFVTLGRPEDGWTRQRAEDELRHVLADVERGRWKPHEPAAVEAPADVPGFHAFASEWLDAHKLDLRERSAEDYRWALTHHLLPYFCRHRLDQITVEEVDRYRAHKLREGALSANTVNKTLTRLAQVLEVAVEYGHIPANPARGRRRRAKASTPTRTWLEPEQVKPLVDAASVRGQRGGKTSPDPRNRAIVATAICSGLRIGELLALRWRDVDLANGRLHVRQSKTDAGERTVELWPELRDELATWRAQAVHAAPSDRVFATATGKPDSRSNVARRLRRAVERANIAIAAVDGPEIPERLTPHSLRRTFASLLYERGEDPVFVMDQLGHADPKLALRIYTRVVSRQRRRGQGERLTGVLGGVQWAEKGRISPESPFSEPAIATPAK